MSPVIAPFITMGAVILLWRRAATKVTVSHRPCGTLPIDRVPRGARPRSRTMLVLTAVSSINTSRAGSNRPCARIRHLMPKGNELKFQAGTATKAEQEQRNESGNHGDHHGTTVALKSLA